MERLFSVVVPCGTSFVVAPTNCRAFAVGPFPPGTLIRGLSIAGHGNGSGVSAGAGHCLLCARLGSDVPDPFPAAGSPWSAVGLSLFKASPFSTGGLVTSLGDADIVEVPYEKLIKSWDNSGTGVADAAWNALFNPSTWVGEFDVVTGDNIGTLTLGTPIAGGFSLTGLDLRFEPADFDIVVGPVFFPTAVVVGSDRRLVIAYVDVANMSGLFDVSLSVMVHADVAFADPNGG